MRDYSQSNAEQYIREKQSMEVGLAFDILEVFDHELIKSVREACKASIVLIDDSLGGSVRFKRDFISKWKNVYTCFHGLGGAGWNADALLQLADTWTASKCGDWIRVYGEIVEEKHFGVGEDVVRTAYQKGPQGSWKKPGGPQMGNALNQPDFQKDRLRRRVEFSKLSQAEKGIYSTKLTPSHELLTSMPFAGAKKWAIMGDDITGKMDDVFGLMPGATISGTTTDNIYFISKFAFAASDPTLYLLPYGTIVSGGHHSLLEVALPLSTNGIIDYRIGCYSTLIPEGFNTTTAQIIRKFLTAYENRLENRLMLVYYRNGRVDGCFVCESEIDKAKWKEKFKANKTLMSNFMSMSNNPSKGRVEAFAAQHGLFAG
jgi:hypothetical protein